MVESDRNYKKLFAVGLMAILFGLIAYSLAQTALTTANDNANITNVFEIVVNNTNLAPNVAGHPFGTGERINATTYYANNSPIQLLVFAHANTASQNAFVEIFINDTLVMPAAGGPLGSAEEAFRGNPVIVPRYASYRVNFSNYHHYEWREYPILSGRNGTLSVNQTIISGLTNASVQINRSQVIGQIVVDDIQNTTKWNKTDNINSTISINVSQVSSAVNDTRVAFTYNNSNVFTNYTQSGFRIESGTTNIVFTNQVTSFAAVNFRMPFTVIYSAFAIQHDATVTLLQIRIDSTTLTSMSFTAATNSGLPVTGTEKIYWLAIGT